MDEQKNSNAGLILAIVAAVGLAVAYFLFRGGGVEPPPPENGPAAPTAAEQLADKNVFVIPYEEQLDVTNEDRPLDMGNIGAHVSLTRPAKRNEEFEIQIRFSDVNGIANPENPVVTFNMKMDMGRFVYHLKPEDGFYKAKVVLPACASGGKRWYGKINADYGGGTRTGIFILDLQ